MNRRHLRVLFALFALVIVAAACGQKSGVAGSDSVSAGGGLGTTGGGGGDVEGLGSETGVGPGDTIPGATGGDTGGATPTGGGTTSGGAAPAGGGTTSGGGTPPAGDRTGITDTTLRIGFHAPLTGAAPVPSESFRDGLPIYWKFIDKSQKGVFGRSVQTVFRDDEFNPSTAVRRCREMVEQEKVFLLLGVAGADQITACAKYANSVGVPYISLGVNQVGLEGLRGYFAASQTYVQQNPILAQLAKKTTKNNKFAILIEDTPTFRESRASIEAGAKDQGLEIVYAKFMSKGASQAEILTTTNELRSSGADVVYFLGPPTVLISLSQQGQGQGYVPAYIGPGLSAGLNLVTAAGCPGLANAKFLSPFPQLDVIDKLDADFKREAKAQAEADDDDIALALWGANKGMHQYLLAAGKDVTRQSLVQVLESGKLFESNIFSKVQYNPKNHFGAQTSHLLAADCNARVWKTEATFVSGL